jgi:transcriptional regulator with XRE-family HTH domain
LPKTATSNIASVVVGRAIHDARKEVGVTQVELARRMGTSAPYVSLVETGRTNPTLGQLSAIASALGVELDVQFRVPAPFAEPTIPQPGDLQTA